MFTQTFRILPNSKTKFEAFHAKYKPSVASRKASCLCP
jgi:hypothetical protein